MTDQEVKVIAESVTSEAIKELERRRESDRQFDESVTSEAIKELERRRESDRQFDRVEGDRLARAIDRMSGQVEALERFVRDLSLALVRR